MTIPKRIRVSRGIYSQSIGFFDEGKQFWGRVVAFLPEKFEFERWRELKRWYTILHIFDTKGAHLQTKHSFMGTTSEGERLIHENSMELLKQWISDLGPVTYQDIFISPFSIEIDGFKFGLLDTSDENGPSLTMEPGDLYFRPPWNGTYDT